MIKSTIDLAIMRGLGLDQTMLQHFANELGNGNPAGGANGIAGIGLSKTNFEKLAADYRDQQNLKDIRSRVFFKILDEAAIDAGKAYFAGAFNLPAAVSSLNRRLAGSETRAKKLEEIYWYLSTHSNSREVFKARMQEALKSVAPERLQMK